jgi:hypothetical protein
MKLSERALIILTCYDFESLQLTLKAIEHTVDEKEKIIIILNGIDTLASAIVERISRSWASENPNNRFVVRPLCSGAMAYFAIKEVLSEYQPLVGIKYICKIDDDIIPLKKHWLNNLASNYLDLSKISDVGFVTGLINNNCWGFNELLDIFDKRPEYTSMFNYKTRGRTSSKLKPGEVNNGTYGNIWQEPYLAWWIHQWTSLNICSFLTKTRDLAIKEIPPNTSYSIGCIFFERQFWLDLNHENYGSMLDEEMINLKCQIEGKAKWALMDQPIIHLFYFNQRLANRDILDDILNSLGSYFNDNSFGSIRRIELHELIINFNEQFKEMSGEFTTFINSVTIAE